jgi:MoaD family protein
MSEVATSARFMATTVLEPAQGLFITTFDAQRHERMARVSVSMFATVREAAGVSECETDASDLDELLRALGSILGQGVADLVARAERDPDGLVILLNGRNVPPGSRKHTRLADGDEVSIFPPVSGG